MAAAAAAAAVLWRPGLVGASREEDGLCEAYGAVDPFIGSGGLGFGYGSLNPGAQVQGSSELQDGRAQV